MNRHSAALCAFCLGLLAQAAAAKDPVLLSLGMEHFAETAVVAEDPGNDSITVSTERGFVEHWGPLHTTWNDEFLKSVIDNKTGRKSFEVDVAITFSGKTRTYTSVSYQGLDGPGIVRMVRRDSMNCAVGECLYTDHVAFPVDEQLLRRLAAAYAPGKPALWTFQLLAKGGPDYKGRISNAEIAGLLAKVDGINNPPAPARIDAVAPQRLEFGISSLAVSPSIELPKRAGVLVVEVHGGSVAHKAGVITGDIIVRLDSAAIKSPRDLEAAVAARTADSTAIIHIYRGTTEMELKAHF